MKTAAQEHEVLLKFQKAHGPFTQPRPTWWPPGGPSVLTALCANDRIHLVKRSTDADWLELVIAAGDTQVTVRRAAERRLRWVNDPDQRPAR